MLLLEDLLNECQMDENCSVFSWFLTVGLSKESNKNVQLDLDIATYTGADQEIQDYASETLVDYI
jgi:hypothetical protein